MPKVWPKNDQMRKVLRHPSGNLAFHAEGPIEWPDDAFTYRRLQDGDVTLEEPKKVDEHKTKEHKADEQKTEEPKAVEPDQQDHKPDSRATKKSS